jgi:hypothetical protein
MYKLNFIAIVSIVAAVTLIVGLAAPALAQQNITGMDNSTMADGGSTMMMDNSTMADGGSTMMNSNSTMIMPNNMTR